MPFTYRKWLAACSGLIALIVSFTCVTPAKAQFLGGWFQRVTQTQAEQPQWMTPLATTTPRLDEEIHFDTDILQQSNGFTTEDYGGGKGLELIPAEHWQINVSPPPYLVHNQPGVANGFGDFGFLVKYRVVAQNEESGNYAVTIFLAGTLPTGPAPNGATVAVLTPTIAYGKGFGNFDLQGTFGISLPTSREAILGRSYPLNNTFQYHFARLFWPELELNYTRFQDGPHSGAQQLFVTPGFMVGRIQLRKRLRLVFGGGFQEAVTHFHTNDHNVLLTVRFPF